MSCPKPITHGLRFPDSGFCVIHRRREFGPFDYEWADDLRSVDLTYRREKYGEFWSIGEMCLDLGPFRLPSRVVQVSVLVTGSLLQSLLLAEAGADRLLRIRRTLQQFGCTRFADSIELPAR